MVKSRLVEAEQIDVGGTVCLPYAGESQRQRMFEMNRCASFTLEQPEIQLAMRVGCRWIQRDENKASRNCGSVIHKCRLDRVMNVGECIHVVSIGDISFKIIWAKASIRGVKFQACLIVRRQSRATQVTVI